MGPYGHLNGMNLGKFSPRGEFSRWSIISSGSPTAFIAFSIMPVAKKCAVEEGSAPLISAMPWKVRSNPARISARRSSCPAADEDLEVAADAVVVIEQAEIGEAHLSQPLVARVFFIHRFAENREDAVDEFVVAGEEEVALVLEQRVDVGRCWMPARSAIIEVLVPS